MARVVNMTPKEVEAARVASITQNMVVRVIQEDDELLTRAFFRKQPTAGKLADAQFVKDCIKHPERFATGGPKKCQSRTWLHNAVFEMDVDAVEALLTAKTPKVPLRERTEHSIPEGLSQDVNAKDDIGRTPLHYACAVGSRPLVELLLRRGAFKDVEEADKAGYRPLHVAAEGGYHGVIKQLITQGDADVNSLGPDGFSALHFICMAGHGVPCLTALFSVGEKLDLYEKDMYGRTPQDILKDVLGRRRGAASHSSKAIRKDHRTPWKELSRAISMEIKRRKDALYLKIQKMEARQKAKETALARIRAGAAAKVQDAMDAAREAFARGETVDFAALGLDEDMEAQLMALMAEEEENAEEEEEEEDDDDDDGDESSEESSAEEEDNVGGADDAGGGAGGGETKANAGADAEEEEEAEDAGDTDEEAQEEEEEGGVQEEDEEEEEGESNLKFPDDYTGPSAAASSSAMFAAMSAHMDHSEEEAEEAADAAAGEGKAGSGGGAEGDSPSAEAVLAEVEQEEADDGETEDEQGEGREAKKEQEKQHGEGPKK